MKNKTCDKCAFYATLYRKIFLRFCKKEQGICCNSQKVVKEKDSCEFYQLPSENTKTIIDLLDSTIKDVIDLKKLYGDN